MYALDLREEHRLQIEFSRVMMFFSLFTITFVAIDILPWPLPSAFSLRSMTVNG
jgi:hypothetical protein